MSLTKFEFTPKEFSDKRIAEDLWEITDEIKCELKLHDNEFFIYTLKEGFKTNYRSGPRWIDKIAPKFGTPKIKMSWMIHDANYEGYLSQKAADELLYFMLLETELEQLNSEIIYIGLRIFGGFNYRNKKDNPCVKFRHEILPSPATRSSKESANAISVEKTNMVFEHVNKEKVNEELKKIAKENNLRYSEEDLKSYYK